MKQLTYAHSDLTASTIGLGCMRMAALDANQTRQVIETCMQIGMNFFDHADIYGGGESEQRFRQGLQLTSIQRDEMMIQSKLGIRQGMYDFSKDYIVQSVEGILQRLGTDYLDILLLHRPDILVEPEEVAEAFEHLYHSGKVKSFGVSNHNIYQIELLKKYVNQPLIINQLQFGPAHTVMIDEGINVNTKYPAGIQRGGDILNYCRLHGITIQPWSPFQVDLSQGLFMKHPDYQTLTQKIQDFSDVYGVSFEAMVLAWILRHPAKMQPIVGSMNPERLEKIAQADQVDLSREHWYDIYRSAGNAII